MSWKDCVVPRMTGKVFTDLALWMFGLGLMVGLAFPLVLILFGVPAALTLRPPFVLACVVAGVLLALLNHVLARRVVGRRLTGLSQQMQYVSGVIQDAAWTGEWGRCTPEECSLPVDSDDELGTAAGSFNELVSSLAMSRQIQQASTDMAQTLSRHLELEEFAPTTLKAVLAHVGAAAGVLAVVRDGQLDVVAAHRLTGLSLVADDAVLTAMASEDTVVLDIGADVQISATVVDFRPSRVVLQPLRFHHSPVGVIVLAFDLTPTSEATRLLRSFATPVAVALNNVLTHERFQRLAAVDPLTGAYNRRFGTERLAEEWARAARGDSHVGVLSLDLDHFKAINDSYGHLAGDRVLRETAIAARAVLREGDVLIRTGGEEFLTLLPGASTDDVRRIGERMRQSVADIRIPHADTYLTVTASLGGASTTDTTIDSCDTLIARSDDALYVSKRSGRDRLTISTTALATTPGPLK
ncbi:diguanylate cyclase [Jannaschia sp. R86511]|uniref:sensor domain-containing diguanylate cyclase n=1 Tax=Jannaschia sp. R86511 TaxID=3093853 RepID=UPI0036D2CD7C